MRVEPDIIRRAQAGDRDALATIVERTYDYVMGFVVRRASNYDYAEEATAETYLTLLLKIDRYEDRGKIEQWLCAIARGHLYHIERRECYRAHPRVCADMAVTNDVEQQVLERIGTEQARRLLSMLAPAHRTVLELRFLAGLDTETTAASLGVSRTSVKYATHHGLQRLRQRLKSERAYHERRFMETAQ